MTYDRRNKVAGGKALHEFIRDAEMDFLEEVAKEMKKGDKSKNRKYEVKRGVMMPMMMFDGTDLSDLSIDGYLALIVNGYDVRVVMQMDHAMLGHKEHEVSMKIGELTPDKAARLLSTFILGVK